VPTRPGRARLRGAQSSRDVDGASVVRRCSADAESIGAGSAAEQPQLLAEGPALATLKPRRLIPRRSTGRNTAVSDDGADAPPRLPRLRRAVPTLVPVGIDRARDSQVCIPAPRQSRVLTSPALATGRERGPRGTRSWLVVAILSEPVPADRPTPRGVTRRSDGDDQTDCRPPAAISARGPPERAFRWPSLAVVCHQPGWFSPCVAT
jgi:hypothetical protein